VTASVEVVTPPTAQARSARPAHADTGTKRRLPVASWIAGAVILLVAICAIFAPLIAPYDPTAGDLSQRLQDIGSPGHILGTDGQGRDILSRLIYGARPSLLTGLIPVAISGIIGTSLGVIAGMGSKWTHGIIMRTLDVFYAFPAVLLAIAIAAALGSGISNSIIALTVILIPPVARIAEAETARVRPADFVEASYASGARPTSIAIRQVLPNIAPAVVVYCAALIGLSIVYAAGLSFLGLGISPPKAEWGLMLSNLDLGQFLINKPELLMIPAVTILLVSVCFNVLGDGLRNFLNVRTDMA
jgi:peptide/nickel transport system permease protein